ncbi:MAG: glycosyltransferase family 2 protein [Cyanobacteria bacterium J007]|nr:MAG: glycosyltransferase family 2 protein [Cyanobacteria bacterium J007]
MPANSWPQKDSYQEFEPLDSILSAFVDSEEELFYRGYKGRRAKAALLLAVVWGGTLTLHFLSWGSWFVFALTGLMGIHALRIISSRPSDAPEALAEADRDHWPEVSLLVAAKNEEAVIGQLIDNLCNLDYPASQYEVWAIDDCSSDGTVQVLERLQQKYPNLKILRRSVGGKGGKSGALNEVFPLTRGEFLAVFDADAQVDRDLLRRVLPVFDRPQVGAVQVRKQIANEEVNFLTRSQAAEMALDSYFQMQRKAVGGIGELRGNGEFIRRQALERCGLFNEQTITDDLDLTVRLHLDRWDIEFLNNPAVREEGVTRTVALWNQRNRWGEGGYQRYLDYWRLILSNRMGFKKTWDLFMFWITQYLLPTAAVPDLLVAIARHRLPILTPVTTLTVALSLIGMFVGLQRIQRQQVLDGERSTISVGSLLVETVRGTLYMFHWFVVVASITARMSVRRKRLKWVKTVHQGDRGVAA